MKPFKASATGTIKMSKINSLRRLTGVASTFYKIIKIINRYIKVFGFPLATLASLYRSSEILNNKATLPPCMQCNLATKSHEGNHAFT